MSLRRLLIAFAIVASIAPVIATATPAAAAAAANEVYLTCFPHERSPDLVYHNTWGLYRSGGRRHKGTDIMSPKGIEVRAVADGVVAKLGDGRTSGYYVHIEHPAGFDTWYMHLNNDDPGTDNGRGDAEAAYAAGLTEGSVVRAGDVIGYVGDSGNAEWTGSHTHFELHVGGRAVNPYPYLVDAQHGEDVLITAAKNAQAEPTHQLAQIRNARSLGELVSSGVSQCVPDVIENAFEHLLREPARERVQLAGVIAR